MAKGSNSGEKVGGPRWIRTNDLGIKSPSICRDSLPFAGRYVKRLQGAREPERDGSQTPVSARVSARRATPTARGLLLLARRVGSCRAHLRAVARGCARIAAMLRFTFTFHPSKDPLPKASRLSAPGDMARASRSVGGMTPVGVTALATCAASICRMACCLLHPHRSRHPEGHRSRFEALSARPRGVGTPCLCRRRV